MHTQRELLFETLLAGSADFFAGGTRIPNLSLKNAVNDSRLDGPGIYRITWYDKKGILHVYDGRSKKVRVRLKQHLNCLVALVGRDSQFYSVDVHLMPTDQKDVDGNLKIAEKSRILEARKRAQAGMWVSTNQRIGEIGELFEVLR
jgi:hypothetical protein